MEWVAQERIICVFAIADAAGRMKTDARKMKELESPRDTDKRH